MNLQSSDNFQIVIPLTKIDHERRMVIGVGAVEEEDLAKEIMDYESAKPEFEAWSQRFVDATGGLSKGNVRVMHQKTVAGRLDQIVFNDDMKRVEVCAKISDQNEWNKVLDGNYTGFSIGGGYAKKWADPLRKGVTRYTPRVAEISLVDSPCQTGARFAELVKADGMVEQIELRGRAPDPAQEIETFGALWKSRSTPMPTFAEAWANRPMTFGELAKAEKKRDDKGRFAAGAVGALAGGSGALAARSIAEGLHDYENSPTRGQAEHWTGSNNKYERQLGRGMLHNLALGRSKTGRAAAIGGAVVAGVSGYLAARHHQKTCPTCGQAMPKAS